MELEEFVCTICFHFFDENEYCPRMLPSCGHTFCSNCLSKMISKLQPDEPFTCPEDRVTWPLNKTDISSFPKNFVLIRLIEKKKTQNPLNKNFYNDMPITNRKLNVLEDSINANNNPIINNHLAKTRSQSIDIPKKDNFIAHERKESCGNENLIHNGLSINTNFNNTHHSSREDSSSNNPSPKSNKSNSSGIIVHETTNNYYNDKCKEHNRKLEIICIDHKCRICTNCALFGAHKNHSVKTEEEVLKYITQRAMNLIDVFSLIEINQNKLFDECFNEKLNAKLKSKYNDMARVIQERFNAYVETIKSQEKRILDEMICKFDTIEEKFKEMRQLPSNLLEKINKWKYNAQDKLNTLNQKTGLNEIAFELLEDRYNIKNDILNIGQKLINDLEKANEIPIKAFEDSLNGISFTFNENFSCIVDTLCTVIFNNDMGVITSQNIHNNQHNYPYNIPIKPSSNMYSMNNINNSALSSSSASTSSSNTNSNQVNYNHNDMNDSVINTNNNNSHISPMILNRINNKNINENSKIAKNDMYDEKSNNKLLDEPTFSKFINKIPINIRLDEENDLLNMEFSNFTITDIPDVIDINKTKNNINKPFTFSPIQQQQLSQNPNFIRLANNNNNNNNINKSAIADTIEESRPRLSFSITPPKIKEVDKENAINKHNPKKKGSIKFPDKYEYIIEGLKSGNMENIDLTGAEIGDIGLSYLSEFIANNKYMKYLKLVRNKLTDEGGTILIKALEKNTTLQALNLTQNLLTEKTFEGFLTMFKTNMNIKTIYFNQNSISLRNTKNKIKDLSKLGININI